ncbi:MAG: hypothetical protein ABEH38_04065 [Flavobacteriales bacterium]
MKKPEDKLESLYQERLGDHEHPVDERVWERVRKRTQNGKNKRGPFFWWSLSGLFLVILGVGIWWVSSDLMGDSAETEKDQKASIARTKQGGTPKERGKKEKEEGQLPSKEKGEKEKEAVDKERKTPASEASKQSSRGNEKDASSKEDSSRDQKQENAQVADRTSSTKAKEASSESAEQMPSSQRERSTDPEASEKSRGGSQEKASIKRGKQGREASSKPEQDTPSEKEKEGTETDAVKEEPASKGNARKNEAQKKEELALLEQRVPRPKGVAIEELDPLGEQPGKIDISKGNNPIEAFYIRGFGSFGPAFRTLRSQKKEKLVSHRNKHEGEVNSFSYGIESGLRWSNGLGAGFGIERSNYGSEFSFKGSQSITDTSFYTDTSFTYIDSTYIDSTGDTITVIVDTLTSYNNDTTVNQRDSSYQHHYALRYRYITLPIQFSYRFELGDRWTVVPTLGVGLNFLTKARTGWVKPESHDKVRLRYPSDPPFRRFALSLRGRLAVRYKIASSWRLGVGFRYSRFVQSVYKDEMGIKEFPYKYGGSFSFTYLLGN